MNRQQGDRSEYFRKKKASERKKKVAEKKVKRKVEAMTCKMLRKQGQREQDTAEKAKKR